MRSTVEVLHLLPGITRAPGRVELIPGRRYYVPCILTGQRPNANGRWLPVVVTEDGTLTPDWRFIQARMIKRWFEVSEGEWLTGRCWSRLSEVRLVETGEISRKLRTCIMAVVPGARS